MHREVRNHMDHITGEHLVASFVEKDVHHKEVLSNDAPPYFYLIFCGLGANAEGSQMAENWSLCAATHKTEASQLTWFSC